MNRAEGSYQLRHIYDYLLPAAAMSSLAANRNGSEEENSGCRKVNERINKQRLRFDEFV